MTEGICKDCVHHINVHNDYPWYVRLFVGRSEFDDRCNISAFRNVVDGAFKPCVTARLIDCNGKPPLFHAKK